MDRLGAYDKRQALGVPSDSLQKGTTTVTQTYKAQAKKGNFSK